MMRSSMVRKILFVGTLFLLLVNAAKNIRSLIQLAAGRAPTVLMDAHETVVALIGLFAILSVAIRDSRLRIAWLFLICNELLALLAVGTLGDADRLHPASVILVGTLLLIIGAVNVMKAKASFIMRREDDAEA
jgi:hypothetical protein